MDPVIFEIDWLDLTPANRWHALHWAPKSRLVEEWREAAIYAARLHRLPKGWESVGVQIQARLRSGQLPDPDAFAPTAKALVDGLAYGPRDPHGYGLIPDDTGEHYKGLLLLPAFKDPSKRSALIVTLHQGGFPWSSI